MRCWDTLTWQRRCPFGAPDEKYGEIVAAAVVPVRPVQDVPAFVKAVQQHAATKLAKFKVRLVSHSFRSIRRTRCMLPWGADVQCQGKFLHHTPT